MARFDSRGRRRTGCGCLIPCTLLFLVLLAAGSGWYVRQPDERKVAVQQQAGIYLDATARTVGSGVDRILDRLGVSWPGDAQPPLSTNALEAVPGTAAELRAGVSRHAYAGVPRATPDFPHPVTVLTNEGFTIGYAEVRKAPAWVAYRLFKVDSRPRFSPPERFDADPRTAAGVTHDDYSGTGYGRGQLAPARAIGRCGGESACRKTFLMSNVVPMRPELRRRVWRNLEKQICDGYAQTLGEVWVIAGPVYWDTSERLPCGVLIPDACFLIVVDEDEGRVRALAFLADQRVTGRENLDGFLTSVDEIEELTGLDVLSDLPDEIEDPIEAKVPRRMWKAPLLP